MAKAILITGFNNWGKTTLIYDLFQRRRFELAHTYQIKGLKADFAVESHSNDDYTESNFIARIQQRTQQVHVRGDNLLCAFCPTREPGNNSIRILNHQVFNLFDKIFLFLLRFKWDHHAELIIQNLQSYYQNTGVSIVVIDADATIQGDQQRFAAKVQQVNRELRNIF
jgi:hypothetical protein